MAFVYLIFVAVVFSWQTNEVKIGRNTKRKAIGSYAAYTITPVILYGMVFIASIGIEELTGTGFIGEGYARSFLFVVVGGLGIVVVSTLIFSVGVFAMDRIYKH